MAKTSPKRRKEQEEKQIKQIRTSSFIDDEFRFLKGDDLYKYQEELIKEEHFSFACAAKYSDFRPTVDNWYPCFPPTSSFPEEKVGIYFSKSRMHLPARITITGRDDYMMAKNFENDEEAYNTLKLLPDIIDKETLRKIGFIEDF